ncbi:MAG: ATP-binding protein [Limnohabitans sp.]|nr:ATP-binding protein [Limnohabitans sp.]
MKISKLYIDEYKHLKDLNFDFTYPMDFHDEIKRGKPLDKICFIGQSGTGKTKLLELIHKDISNLLNTELDEDSKIWINFNKYDSTIGLQINENNFSFKEGNYYLNGNIIQRSSNKSTFTSTLIKEAKSLFYFTAELLSTKNLEFFEKEPILLIEKSRTFSFIEQFAVNENQNIIFNDNIEEEIWIRLLNSSINYLQNFLQFATELINSGNVLDNSSQNKIDAWKSENINPLIDFSEKFNIILEKIQLEVDLTNAKNIIPLKNKNTGENVDIKNISTGTKQLLLNSLPLYKLETKESIILIDEPERSLYPDMQMELIDHYKKLAPKAQFIIATHSPFIAASFEPCERFILYFDEEGKVAVRQGTSPIGDDPNDIVYEDFGVNYYNKNTQEKFKEYIELLDKAREEIDKEKKKNYILKATKIGDLYNFDINEKNIQRHQ